MSDREVDIKSLFREYKGRIYRLAWSMARNEKDAEDILQNTFLKVTQNLGQFRFESKISTWIYRIAYNEALMYLRKKYRRYRLSDYLNKPTTELTTGLFISRSKLPDKELLDNELKERLETSIRRLPIKYRMPLLLHNVEGMPLKDAAFILGLKVNSLKTRLHRAYVTLKSDMASYNKDSLLRVRGQSPRCSAWTGFLHKYVSGGLDKKSSSSFDRHMKDCSDCKSFLDSYIKAIRITKALECRDIPQELQKRIESFLTGGRK